MTWQYSLSLLEDVCDNYHRIYSGWAEDRGITQMSAAEIKADFDMALVKLSEAQRKAIENYVEGYGENEQEKADRGKGIRKMKELLNG